MDVEGIVSPVDLFVHVTVLLDLNLSTFNEGDSLRSMSIPTTSCSDTFRCMRTDYGEVRLVGSYQSYTLVELLENIPAPRSTELLARS